MKYILILIFLFSISYADEIQRIELIVKDIVSLRAKYETSQDELNSKIINEKKQHERILKLEIQIKNYKKQLKIKEKKIKKLKPKKKQNICKPEKIKPSIVYKVKKLENPNKFPKLMMKQKYVKYKKIRMKAKTHRLLRGANVYDAKYGSKIEFWQSGTAFTSNEKAVAKGYDTWIKVTGYFIKNSWIPVSSSMWLKDKNIK